MLVFSCYPSTFHVHILLVFFFSVVGAGAGWVVHGRENCNAAPRHMDAHDLVDMCSYPTTKCALGQAVGRRISRLWCRESRVLGRRKRPRLFSGLPIFETE